MKFKSIILLTLLTIFAAIPSTYASMKHVRAVYNDDYKTVTYSLVNKMTGWSSNTMLEFYKTVDVENNAAYHVRGFFTIRDSKNRFSRPAMLIVDDKVYDLKLVPKNMYICDNSPCLKGDYIITEEMAQEIAAAKSNVSFQFFIEGQKPTILNYARNQFEELKIMTGLSYADYKGDWEVTH